MAKFLYDDGEKKSVIYLPVEDTMPAMRLLDQKAEEVTGVSNPYVLVGVGLGPEFTAHFEPKSGVGPYVKLTKL